jgi:YD repeat-containing protein
MRVVVTALLIYTAACSDPDRAPVLPTAARPGPCTSHSTGGVDCTWTYDDQQRVTAVDCTEPDDATRAEAYTYAAATGPALAVYVERLSRPNVAEADWYALQSKYDIWTFGVDEVTLDSRRTTEVSSRDVDATFAATLVRPWRHPFETERSWSYGAEDSLLAYTEHVFDDGCIYDESDEFTYVDGDGVRTRTDRQGNTVTFTYNADGRLVEVSGPSVLSASYTWTGPRLDVDALAGSEITYEHDAFDNLIRRVSGDDVTTFDYFCWE